MNKLKGFISYAHEDEAYFKLIKEGLRKHGKHSRFIDSDLWHDGKIKPGALWHESIQEQVKGCDFAIFLVSSNFLASDYIEEHEFKNFLKRQDEEGFLFFPILASPCDFNSWEHLAARQFFKPNGNAYNCPEAGAKFTFSHLVQWNLRTGETIPNPYREQYFMDALVQIEAALQEYNQRKSSPLHLPTSPYFQIRHISAILPEHILETRSKPSQGYRPYYLYRRYIDERLLYNFRQGHHTIITGKPLAGKSRAVLELCRNLKDENVQIWFPLRRDFRMEDFRLPDTDTDVILFLDDFEQFLHLENLDLALEAALLKPNIRVMATCRKSELPKVEERLSDLMPNFESHEILLLNASEKDEILREALDRVSSRSDGTAGGYFFPLVEMRKRYHSLPDGGLEREILHACKALRHWGLTEPGGLFSKEKIQNYCLKRLEHYYGQYRKIPPFEWNRAYHILSQKELLFDGSSAVEVEELYLESFVPATGPKLEKEILDFLPSVINYTKALNKALNKTPNFELAQSVLEAMKKEGLRPDEVTFNSLLNKAPNFEMAQSVLELMKKEGLRPDEVTFSSLLNKAPNFEMAQSVLEGMKKEGIRPNEVTFNSLLNKAPNFELAQSVLEDMKKEGIRPDEVTFNSLLNKAPNFEMAQSVLEDMKKEGLRPDEVTFNSLLNKAPNFEMAQSVLEDMKKEGLRPDEVTFNSLLNKAPNFEMAQSVLEGMKKEDLRPNEVTFNSLLNKAPNFELAQSVLGGMKKEGLRPNEVTFTSLLNKAPNFELAQSVLKLMKKEGLRPNEVTFNSLLNKAPNFELAQSVLELMKKEGIRPDEFTFNSLLNKAPNFEMAQSVLELMKKEGLRPDEVTFSSLLNKAPNFEMAQSVLEDMKKESLRPDKFTFSSLLNRAPNFEMAQSVLELMKKEGLRPDEVTFSSLLNKAPNFELAQSVLEGMKKEGIRPNEVTFNSLLNKAPNFELAQSVLEDMKKEGIRPDEVTFNSLLNKAPNFEMAQSVLELMKKEGLLTFSSLLNKAPNFEMTQSVLELMKKEGLLTFSSLLNKAPNFEMTQSVLELMKKEGLRPDEVTFNSLLNKAPNFEMAQSVLELMKKEGLRPDEVTFSSLLNKAPNFEMAQSVLEGMKKEGIRPNEVTFNSLLNKAPNFELAQSVLEDMKKEGIRPDEVTFNSLLNKAPNFEMAQSVFEQARFFQIPTDRKIYSSLLKIARLDRKNHTDEKLERAFFKQHFLFLSKQEDSLIRLFAEAMQVPEHKAKLLECLHEKNWWYWKFKADITITTDWESAFRYLDLAMKDVPISYRAHTHAIWAKNVVFNDLQELFESAENHCLQALEIQPKGNMPYTGKLLLWLILRRHTEFEAAMNKIHEMVSRYGFPQKQLQEFLANALWRELPSAPLAHFKEQIKQWARKNKEQSDEKDQEE